ncbi:MAG: cadherin-like domain-containing protein, partial [Halobacteriovoraceae bacterium]|nr:cadherin-like domain-containing protein [Halobacteriovoraceae bacterium]
MRLFLFLILISSCKPDNMITEFSQTISPTKGVDKEVQTKEDEPLTVQYQITKTDDAISPEIKISSQPKSGALTECKFFGETKVECLYTPNENFHGEDYIGFIIQDGDFRSEPSFVKIDISSVPDQPIIAERQTVKVLENTVHSFNVSPATDVDSKELNYKIIAPPTHGHLSECMLTNNDLNCQYTPQNDFYGKDMFVYQVQDETGLVATDDSAIFFEVLNRPQVGNDIQTAVNQNSKIIVTVPTAFDHDSQKISYKINVSPIHGEVENCFKASTPLSCTYIPNKDYYGTDSITYFAIDDTNVQSEKSA